MIPSFLTVVDELRRFGLSRGIAPPTRSVMDMREVVQSLGLTCNDAFFYFYSQIQGPFSSGGILPDLLDITAEDRNIIQWTVEFRRRFPRNDVLVLSEIYTGACIFYDTAKDHVFLIDIDYDFELFLDGNAVPEWSSFELFIIGYFSEYII